jgi:hypothetical protein
LGFLPYEQKIVFGSIAYPYYGYCLLQAAKLAHKLGQARISAIEFGVAGGNGLVALEMHAAHIKRMTGVEITIYGFDSGAGMPPSRDFRDLPYAFWRGLFPMNLKLLRSKLRSSELIIGQIDETVPSFIRQERPPPIGFVSIDLDYYYATKVALTILEATNEYLLPRVVCYFDDVSGGVELAYNEFTGELLAIREFNEKHEHMKIAPIRGLRYSRRWPLCMWHEQVFVAHIFNHPDYGHPVFDHLMSTQLDVR